MGLRGKGATPKVVSIADARQGMLGFDPSELAEKQREDPWNAPGLSRVERVIAFLEDLPITQGSLAGQNLAVRPWQRKFLEAVYAEDQDGGRPIRTAVLSMARKNGKTQLVAGLALCHLIGPEAEARGEVYAAANDRFQSGKTFNELVAILDERPALAARVPWQSAAISAACLSASLLPTSCAMATTASCDRSISTKSPSSRLGRPILTLLSARAG